MPGLGRWVMTIRDVMRRIEKNPSLVEAEPQKGEPPLGAYSVSASRLQRLKDIGMEWNVVSVPISFEQRLVQLAHFRAQYG